MSNVKKNRKAGAGLTLAQIVRRAGAVLTLAQIVRRAFRIFLNSRPKVRPAPALHDDNPLLPDVPGDDLGKLPLSLQGRDLKVQINAFDDGLGAGLSGTFMLAWDGEQLGDATDFTTPFPVDFFPLVKTLPGGYSLTEGRHSLTYEVITFGNRAPSDPLEIFIDHTPPGFNQPQPAVILPEAVEADGITMEYLDANGGVEITVPANHPDRKPNDVVSIFYGSSQAGAVKVADITLTDADTPATYTLTPAQIGPNDGLFVIFYQLMDRVGNISVASNLKWVNVRLTPAPADLEPLAVPLADDGLIDLDDAVMGVQALIEPYTNYVAGDRIAVTWDGQAVQLVDAVPSGQTLVPIPYSVLLNGDRGLKTIQATYAVARASGSFPEGTDVDVDVDLRYPGPINPEEPELVNPNLQRLTVVPPVSTTNNRLTTEDAGQDATATIPLYDNPKPGDVVQLFWDGVEVDGASYTVLGSEAIDFVLRLTVPWETIEAAGNNPALPATYSIAHPEVNANVVFAPDRLVDVNVLVVTLPEVTFANTQPGGDLGLPLVNCSAALLVPPQGRVLQIDVAGGDPKLSGQTLTFTYHAVPRVEEADDVTYEFTHVVSANEANNGFSEYVPYTEAIKLADAIATIEYSLTYDGLPATSEKHRVHVYLNNAGGGFCVFP